MSLPAPQARAAAIAGRLAAQCLLDPAEALPALALAAGTRHAAALQQALAQAAAEASAARRLVAWRAGRAVAPLLAARRPGSALLAATLAADPQGWLLAHERRALVEQAMRRALRG